MSTNTERTRATAFGLIKGRDESGSFPVGERDERPEHDLAIAEVSAELVSLIPDPPLEARRNFAPPPRSATPSERAELVIEDLSLQLDNPYIASSLVPPPKQPFALRRTFAIGLGMLAAAAIGASVQLSVLRGAHQTQTHAGVARIAPTEAPAAPIAMAPVPAPVAAVAPTITAAAPTVELPQLEQPRAVEPVVASASPRRIARVAPPAPPEPNAAVAEVAMPSAVTAAAALPDYPTRDQVTAGFESIRAALSQCAAGRSGRVDIQASIASTGRIVHALVGGDFKGTVEGSCMARAVREAQFPAFAQARLKVGYPISL